jgi:hypothetical protein
MNMRFDTVMEIGKGGSREWEKVKLEARRGD